MYWFLGLVFVLWVIGWCSLLKDGSVERCFKPIRKNFMFLFDVVVLLILLPISVGVLEIVFVVARGLDELFR